jgi:hypothetical protein
VFAAVQKFEYLAKPADPDTTVGSVFHSHPVDWQDDELAKSVRSDWPSFLLIEGPSDTGLKTGIVALDLMHVRLRLQASRTSLPRLWSS